MALSLTPKKITWPEGKRFAFTVFDDTDFATLANVQPVYSLLHKLGLKTTKSAWILKAEDIPINGGATCDDADYLRWLLELRAEGFEIAYHMATCHGSPRERTIEALDRYFALFGEYPHSSANHVGCAENIYWGGARLSGLNRRCYDVFTRFRNHNKYQGEIEGSRYFWGDICKERIQYVRNFVYPEINTLKTCQYMPYHDPFRPYVNYWFAASDGNTVDSFNHLIREDRQDQLEIAGGACIIYTHFALGFNRHGEINPRFAELIKRLSHKNGWFVPVYRLLDFLKEQSLCHEITTLQRQLLEWRWMIYKLRRGTG